MLSQTPAQALQAQIQLFETLAVVDADLKVLGDERSREREALTGKQQRLAELDLRLGRDRASLEEMERLRSELLTEMRQMSHQLEKSREKLARCRTEREANAAQREVEELRKLFRDREIEIEKLVGLCDQARSDIQTVTADRDQLAQELGSSQGQVESRLGEVEREITSKEQERSALGAKLPQILFRRYELIRKRRGTALCWSNDGMCSACHILLPPMMFHHLMRNHEFAQCPSCNRILYYRPSIAEAVDQQPDAP